MFPYVSIFMNDNMLQNTFWMIRGLKKKKIVTTLTDNLFNVSTLASNMSLENLCISHPTKGFLTLTLQLFTKLQPIL